MTTSRERFPTETPAVVTCGLPYANGKLHLGHLRTYIGGDVLARALRTLGQQTAFVSGSDMHGTPIAVNARQEGVSPESFALRWHETYQTTFPQFHIEFDNYGHTHDEANTALTREIVRDLDEGGYIYEAEIDVAWDAELDQPLPDRYIEGTCPYCGATARGDECENCGRHLESGELEQPHSILTDNPATYRTRRHKFFRLSEFQDYLREFIGRLEGTSNAKNQPREWIENELKDWNITRDLDWGIDYPGDGGDDLVLYVWVDAPIEYIASTKQYSDRVGTATFDWAQAWKQGDGEFIHIIGRDIIQHHTVFWPAILHGVNYTEPRAVVASGFMTLDGEAFSTSRKHAVWVDDYLNAGLDPDLYRYYITTGTGFQQDLDFSWEHFQERVNDELIGTIGNFCYRTLLFATRTYDGVPDETIGTEVRDRIDEACTEFQDGINSYSTREATSAGIRLARYGNQYLQRHEPWTLTDSDPERAMQVIRECVQLVKAIAILLEPVMPEKSAELWEQLGEASSVHTATLDTAFGPPASEFGEVSELFDPISDEQITVLNEQLRAQRTEE